MLLEVCQSNEITRHIEKLEEDGFDVIVYPCLDRCERCPVFVYAYADGDLVECGRAASLIRTLRERRQTEASLLPDDEPW